MNAWGGNEAVDKLLYMGFMISVFNSDVVRLICMLICIAVVVCFFIYRYSKGADIQDPKGKVQKLHTFYISGILVFIIVELVTGLCMGNDMHSDILSYVNFAATLSSLIMSVVAIIFTIVSGSRGDEQFKKIDNASDKVAESLAKFSEKTDSIDDSISVFKDITDTLSGQMNKILEKVEGVDKTSRAVLDQVSRSQSTEGSPSHSSGERDTLNGLQDFVSISSYSGKLALLACVLSKESGKSFNVKDIAENGDDEAYMYGYIIASIAAGILSINPSYNRVIVVLNYIKGLKEILENAIQAVIDSSPNETTKEVYKKRVDTIKEYFSKA